MAVKDQCEACASYKKDSDYCLFYEQKPIFNGISCDKYQELGINNDNEDSTQMFKNIFSFNGRIRRHEYGFTFLVYVLLCYLPPQILSSAAYISPGFAILWLFLVIFIHYITLAQGAKRCHDLGLNGWWQLIPFFFVWLIFEKGEEGSNKYGDNPKE